LLEIVLWLYDHQPALKMVVSFRQEYLGTFLRLGPDIHDLVYDLLPMEVDTLRSALVESARRGKTALEPAAIDELMSWLTQRAGTNLGNPRADALDLLNLQAVLVELYSMARSLASSEPVVIDKTIVESMQLAARQAGEDEAPSGQLVIGYALERFLDRYVLPLPAGMPGTDGLPNTLTDDDAAALEIRRAAARMAPDFSAGTFKVSQMISPLFSQAWKRDWAILGTTAEDIAGALSQDEKSLAEYLELEPGRIDPKAGILSGTSRGRLSAIEAVEHLLAISQATLEALIEGGVLRAKPTMEGLSYELVHDGFGTAFIRWAEEKAQTPADPLVAITAQRGEEFNWRRLTGMIDQACWRGCWVGPETPKGTLMVDEARFYNCDLGGSLFQDCVFEGTFFDNCDLGNTTFERCKFNGGGFLHCDLDFAVFQDCYFDEGFVFDYVHASGLTFTDGGARRMTIRDSELFKMWWTPPAVKMDALDLEDVRLERCTLSQWTIDEVRLAGSLHLSRCSIKLSDLLGLTKWASQVDFEDCTLVYCPVNGELDGALRRGRNNRRYPAELAAENWEDMALGPEDLPIG
jgi:uncharacterized protein YjbI with pentapeptide repeats